LSHYFETIFKRVSQSPEHIKVQHCTYLNKSFNLLIPDSWEKEYLISPVQLLHWSGPGPVVVAKEGAGSYEQMRLLMGES
jgi:hypothetical protein